MAALELRPFLLPVTDDPSYFADFPQAGSSYGLSTSSWQSVMRGCYDGLATVVEEQAMTPDKAAFMEACDAMSRRMVTVTPSYGPGWLIVAYVALSRRDRATFSHGLSMARMVAPREQWQAEKRIAIAEARSASLSAADLHVVDADIRLLAASELGRTYLAGRSKADPALRDRVIQVIEGLRSGVQPRLSSHVSRPMRDRALASP